MLSLSRGVFRNSGTQPSKVYMKIGKLQMRSPRRPKFGYSSKRNCTAKSKQFNKLWNRSVQNKLLSEKEPIAWKAKFKNKTNRCKYWNRKLKRKKLSNPALWKPKALHLCK